MTTATIEKKMVSFEDVKVIVKVMKSRNVNHIFPSKISNSKLRNEAIIEIIIDEEGNVFLMTTTQAEPVMLPHLAMVV